MLTARVRSTSCCGLFEYHNLRTDPVLPSPGPYGPEQRVSVATARRCWPGRALFATTTRDQVAAVKALKAEGFVKLDSWRNGNTGRRVTFWFLNPDAKRPKPKKKKGKK